jgi:hypothetical protein
MARQFLYVFTDATPGHDKEFNEWYDKQHLPEVLDIPGFVAAKRYRQTHDVGLPEGTVGIDHEYLATYEIEGDPSLPLAELVVRRDNGTIQMPPYIESSRQLVVFTEIEDA